MSGHRPLRLLWLIDSLTIGGAENLVAPLMRSLDRARFAPQLCCLATISGNALQEQLLRDGIATTNLAARNFRDLGAFRRLLHLVRDEQIDVIHSHLTYASIWGALVSRLTGVPVVASLHVAPPTHGMKARVLDRTMRLVLNRWSARVIAVSGALRNQYLAAGGIDARAFLTVHNGIETERFASDRAVSRSRLLHALGLPVEAALVVTVSVLREGKGIEVLLEAARAVSERIRDVFFLIVGDGPKREEWTDLARRLGIQSRLRWLGHREDIPAILPGCDLFVLPSLNDAFPTVLLEAMAASLPIVATHVGGIPEIVTPRVTGELVPPGDSGALSNAIAELLEHRSRARQMGVAGQATASRTFSMAAWLARLTAIYEQIAPRQTSV